MKYISGADEIFFWWGLNTFLGRMKIFQNTFDNGLVRMRRVSAGFTICWKVFHTDHIAHLDMILQETILHRDV